MLLVALYLSIVNLNAQEEPPITEMNCGEPTEVGPAPSLLPTVNRFDSQQARGSGGNCERIWIRVNVHYFLDNNCNGSIYPLPGVPYDMDRAYSRAEQLINECNNQLANDTDIQWAQVERWGFGLDPGQEPIQGVQCNPIRYALSGVYIHCNTVADDTTGQAVSWFRDNFGVNIDSEVNAFMVEWQLNANGFNATGQADAFGGRAFTTENFGIQVFNHEMGHVLNLRHTFSTSEGLSDTPDIRFRTDYNCDGDNNDSWSNGIETINESEIHDSRVWCKPLDCPDETRWDPLDYDLDGLSNYQDPCDPQLSELEPGASLNGCMPEPYCNDDFHSNNIMNYSRYSGTNGVFTSQQIDVMLNYLNIGTPDFIEALLLDDQCPPPMSNIHIFPNEDANDCAYCFQLEATMHDEFYRIEFLTQSGGVQYDTGWKSGPAVEECLSQSIKYPWQYKHGFQPNTPYIARMTVENICGDQAVEDRPFTLPSLSGCGPGNPPTGVEILSMYPNPFTGNITYEYSIDRSGLLQTWLIPSDTSVPDMLLDTEQLSSAGTYTNTVTAPSNIPSGPYYLVLDLDGEIIGSVLLKL